MSGDRAGGATSAELASSFDAEPDDPAWATAIEPDVRARAAAAVADAGARFGEVRCRSQRCRITADGDEDAVGRAIARLEEPGGLAGLADALVVAATEPTADGGLHLVVYAYFERDPAAP
ncbi:MAG: hypothetical protein H6709_19165 [Kofleriaceae bacterium]|nr:hypothetical protein [Kofleriaceae bacterium]MCB9574211.1 hypothetical protein [Kofleriaceae bacterium]